MTLNTPKTFALKIENIDDENKVKALMSKGNCYYRTKQLLKNDHDEGTYAIRMDSEFDMDIFIPRDQ